jgi:RNA polymerase sigma factor (sigma-70 family)
LNQRQLARRDRLVLAHLALVDEIARAVARRLPPSWDIADLIQVGRLGLLDAATKFDPARGVPFPAYARKRIRGEMYSSARRRSWRDGTHAPLEEAVEPAGDAGIEDAVERGQRAKVVSIAIARLEVREEALVRRHYLGAQEELQKIGRELGLGQSRASQLHRKALEDLKDDLERRWDMAA